MTKEELAIFLKVTPRTIDRWRITGMPCLKAGKIVRFDKAKVIQWLERQDESEK